MYETSGSISTSSKQPASLSSSSKCNAHEAELVRRHVALLLAHGLPPTHISVLAPYASQVALLASTLRGEWPELALDVGTVDAQQGRENECVVALRYVPFALSPLADVPPHTLELQCAAW
jgi:superfamily I DNA and/or RNA helicase